MRRELECRVSIRFDGFGEPIELNLNRLVSQIDLDEILPPRDLSRIGSFEVLDVQQRSERQQRFIDFISSDIAHALTEALFEKAKNQK